MNFKTKILAGAGTLALVAAGSGIAVAAMTGSGPSQPVQVLTPSGASGATTTVAPSTTTTVPVTTTTVPHTTTTTVAVVDVPNVVADTVSYAESVLTSAGLKYVTTGNGTDIGSQSPVPGSSVPAGSTVTLSLYTAGAAG